MPPERSVQPASKLHGFVKQKYRYFMYRAFAGLLESDGGCCKASLELIPQESSTSTLEVRAGPAARKTSSSAETWEMIQLAAEATAFLRVPTILKAEFVSV